MLSVLGKSFTFSLISAVVLASCIDDPVPATDTLSIDAVNGKSCGDSDDAIANGACRVSLSLKFPNGSDPGISVTLQTDTGELVSAVGAKDSAGAITLSTISLGDNGIQKDVAYLTGVDAESTALVSAKIGSAVATKEIDFVKADASQLDLSATVRTFRAEGGRASDFEVALRRDVGTPSSDTRVELYACCAGESETLEDCDDNFSIPRSITTTDTAKTSLEFEGRLTAEAEDYLAQKVAVEDVLQIYVYAGIFADGAGGGCSGTLETARDKPAGAVAFDVVELRLVRKPPEKDSADAGTL